MVPNVLCTHVLCTPSACLPITIVSSLNTQAASRLYLRINFYIQYLHMSGVILIMIKHDLPLDPVWGKLD